MSEELKPTEVEPVKTTPEITEEKPVEKTTEEPKKEETPKEEPQKTVGELVEETKPDEKPNLIPESVFLGEKKARKAAEKELKALKESIQGGASKQEISESIAEIADEHNIDKGFLQKLASTIKAETEKELDEKYSSKFETKDKQEKFEKAFDRAYAVAIERAPEFKAIANPDVIKTLSLQPQNSNKTISQILEDIYGNAITGKRTIETTSPGGGKEPEPLNFEKARKDSKYFDEVMAMPALKKEYNKLMLERGF